MLLLTEMDEGAAEANADRLAVAASPPAFAMKSLRAMHLTAIAYAPPLVERNDEARPDVVNAVVLDGQTASIRAIQECQRADIGRRGGP